MARNLLKSNNSFVAAESWGTGQTPVAWQGGGDFSIIQVVQGVSLTAFGASNSRENLTQIGTQDLVSQDLVRQPDVTFGISYTPNWPLENDFLLASFHVPFTKYNQSTSFNYILDGKLGASRNFYIFNCPTGGLDAFATPDFVKGDVPNLSGWDCISFGNCYCTSYSLTYGIGALPQVTTDFVGSNMQFDLVTGGAGTRVPSPAIDLTGGNQDHGRTFGGEIGMFNKNPVVFNPTDTGSSITLQNLQMGGQPISGLHFLQSVDLSIDFPRVTSYRLGSNYPCERKHLLPAQGRFSFSSLVSGFETGNLTRGQLAPSSMAMPTEETYQFDLLLAASGKELSYRIEGARLESYSYSMAINDGMNFNGDFSFQVTESQGLSMSGSPPL